MTNETGMPRIDAGRTAQHTGADRNARQGGADPGRAGRSGVDLSLDPPSAYVFTGEICSRSYPLNRFAFDFKHDAVRRRFAADPEGLMSEYGLSAQEKALVRARDWTGLVSHGGHHFNIIKIAAAVGESHLHVGAHMAGVDWDELKQTLPHRIDLMPEDLPPAPAAAEADAANGGDVG